MITKFKIYENNEYSDLVKLCKDKFFILHPENRSISTSNYLLLVRSIDIDNKTIYHSMHSANINLHMTAASFGRNIRFENHVWNYSKNDLEKIDFMTSLQLFKKYPDICTDLYSFILDIDVQNKSSLYLGLVEDFKNSLSVIPDIEKYTIAKKYGL